MATRWIVPSWLTVAQFRVWTPPRNSSISSGVILIWLRWLTPWPNAVASSLIARTLPVGPVGRSRRPLRRVEEVATQRGLRGGASGALLVTDDDGERGDHRNR